LTAHLTDRKRMVNEEFRIDFLYRVRLISGTLNLQALILADSIIYGITTAESKSFI